MLIDSEYNFGDVVYLKTDEDQAVRIITGAIVMPNCILFELSCGANVTKHYDFEFSKEKSLLFI